MAKLAALQELRAASTRYPGPALTEFVIRPSFAGAGARLASCYIRPMIASRRSLLVIAFALFVVAVGCKGKAETRATYTVRGVVKTLPTSDDATVGIHHEAVKGFVNIRGEQQDMASMTMHFGVGSVDTSALKVGDKIEFRFDVSWKRKPTLQLLSFKPLPADTALTLEEM